VKLGTAVTLLVAALVLLLTSHWHDSAHRFDVVVAAAGSGGSQQEAGSTTEVAYLIDHKTGRVWRLDGGVQQPTFITPLPTEGNGTRLRSEVITPNLQAENL
jgi:hypothetical protein